MKLRNKKTGQIGNFIINKDHFECADLDYVPEYESLTELNDEWEDVREEPKKYWYITGEGDICRDDIKYSEWIEERKSIGNYFETKEEAEKAREKLRAWKRLRKNHFKFDEYDILNQTATWLVSREYDEYSSDIDLLFGGEANADMFYDWFIHTHKTEPNKEDWDAFQAYRELYEAHKEQEKWQNEITGGKPISSAEWLRRYRKIKKGDEE